MLWGHQCRLTVYAAASHSERQTAQVRHVAVRRGVTQQVVDGNATGKVATAESLVNYAYQDHRRP